MTCNSFTQVKEATEQYKASTRVPFIFASDLENSCATAKHFPGDGCDYRDQHLTTTCNSLPFEEWLRKHGAVFQALFDEGQPGDKYLPATLSRELTNDLLKREMGFRGLLSPTR